MFRVLLRVPAGTVQGRRASPWEPALCTGTWGSTGGSSLSRNAAGVVAQSWRRRLRQEKPRSSGVSPCRLFLQIPEGRAGVCCEVKTPPVTSPSLSARLGPSLRSTQVSSFLLTCTLTGRSSRVPATTWGTPPESQACPCGLARPPLSWAFGERTSGQEYLPI